MFVRPDVDMNTTSVMCEKLLIWMFHPKNNHRNSRSEKRLWLVFPKSLKFHQEGNNMASPGIFKDN